LVFIATLDFYTHEEMVKIIERSQKILGLNLSYESIYEVAKRSRGVPRIANRILKENKRLC